MYSNISNSLHTSLVNKTCKMYYKKELGNRYTTLYEEKLNNLDPNSKLQLFKSIQLENMYSLKYYLNCFNFEYRKLICKLRISDHSLEIERGRYKKIARHDRKCTACKVIDDEIYFFFNCSINESLRKIYLSSFEFENILTLQEKIKIILNPETNEQVRLLGSFLKQSFLLKTGGS